MKCDYGFQRWNTVYDILCARCQIFRIGKSQVLTHRNILFEKSMGRRKLILTGSISAENSMLEHKYDLTIFWRVAFSRNDACDKEIRSCISRQRAFLGGEKVVVDERGRRSMPACTVRRGGLSSTGRCFSTGSLFARNTITAHTPASL